MSNFQRWLRTEFYFAPDEGGSAGAADAASAASQGAASQAPASTSATSAGGTGGGLSTPSSGAASSSTSTGTPASVPQSGASGLATAPAATPEYTSIIDVIKGYGATDLATQYAGNEHGLLQHLLMERARAGQLEPVVRQLQENSGEWQEFLRQRSAAKQATANDPWYAKFGFKPPEWNPAWERQIVQDANGNLSVAPGADPSLVRKYQEHKAFRQQLAEKFLANPYEFMQAPVQELAKQIAQQEIQRHLGGYQDQVFANNIVGSNPWLFAKDQAGNPMIDPRNNAPVLSPEGVAYRNAVAEAQNMGITDVRNQHKYALALVQRDYALGEVKRLTPAQQQQQANQQFLEQAQGAGANHNPSVGPATVPAPANGNPLPPPGNATLDPRVIAERLTRNLVAGGYQLGQPIAVGNN